MEKRTTLKVEMSKGIEKKEAVKKMYELEKNIRTLAENMQSLMVEDAAIAGFFDCGLVISLHAAGQPCFSMALGAAKGIEGELEEIDNRIKSQYKAGIEDEEEDA